MIIQNNKESTKYKEKETNEPALAFENLHGWCEGDEREEGYCVGRLLLSLTESLLSLGSMETFSSRATLTRNLSDNTCFCLLLRISRKRDIALTITHNPAVRKRD